jgi:raffinose/stachyose/melibiose transport system substrate-binding protein
VPHVEETTKVPGRLRHTRIFAGIAAAALALSACAPGASETADTGGSTDTTTEQASGISKEVPTDVDITLTLSTWEVGGLFESIDAIVQAYEAKYPNVDIVVDNSLGFGDYGSAIKLKMSGDDAPDIAQAGQGYTMMGPLVEAGLLRPLDDYAELYGWADRFGPGLLDQARFEPDGSKFGTGDLYGLAKGGNMVGVFFNREIMADLGLTPPFADWASFSGALEAAQAAGYIPMALGNSEQWPANHTLSILISQTCDNATMLGWIYGNAGSDFTSDCFLKAAETMEAWADGGLIDPAANSLSFEDGINRFAEGNSAFFVTGNWALPTMVEKMGENVGFAGFPPVDAGGPARATGATTSPFTISAKTEWPDVAANFIDFMTGPETADLRANGGYAPLLTDVEIATADATVINEYNAVWKRVIAEDGLTLFLDWSTVGMGAVLFPAIQELIANRTDAASLVEVVQAEWVAGRS